MANPLFSTYRQGENRVTASFLAVLERLSFPLVERILQALCQEPEKPLLSFANQPKGVGSTPDARIRASFAYWIETKTAPNAVSLTQIQNHLAALDSESKVDRQRLLVLTPDASTPAVLAGIKDERVAWSNFNDLLIVLRDVLAPPANWLIDMCQPNRAFQRSAYLGFYAEGRIYERLPRIRGQIENVVLAEDGISTLADLPSEQRLVLVTLVGHLQRDGSERVGTEAKVLFLSSPDEDATIQLPKAGATVTLVLFDNVHGALRRRAARSSCACRANTVVIDLVALQPRGEAISLPDGSVIGPRLIVEAKDEHDWEPLGKEFGAFLRADVQKMGDQIFIPAGAKGVKFTMLRQQHFERARAVFGTDDFDRLFVIHAIDEAVRRELTSSLRQRRIYVVTIREVVRDLLEWYVVHQRPSGLRQTLVGDLVHLLVGFCGLRLPDQVVRR